MKLKLPPPLIAFVFGLLMYVLAKILPIGAFDFFGRPYLMKGLLFLGVIVASIALIQFFHNKTTTDPTSPSKATHLVTNGLYNYTRNPMYLAMLLVLLAWGLWLGNAFNVLVAAGFVSYMNAYQIIPEEKALGQIFGKAYHHYCVRVRRWF
ncbi:MAG: isoprenylcysteine carboxylmethyltransferase family protein [Bacteroidota bacterium]